MRRMIIVGAALLLVGVAAVVLAATGHAGSALAGGFEWGVLGRG